MSFDRYGQIINEGLTVPSVNEEVTQIFPVDAEESAKIGLVIDQLQLERSLVAVGCYSPLEIEGTEVKYFDSYDSVGRPEKVVDTMNNLGIVYINVEYSSLLEIPDNSMVLTNNKIKRDLVLDRQLLAVVKDGEIMTNDEQLEPYRNELLKTKDQLEEENSQRRLALRAKLSGEEVPKVEPD